MSDGYIVRGHRHSDAIRTAHDIPRYENERPHGDDQGFVTSQNEYVTRFQAMTILQAAGIPSVLPAHDAFRGGECYSEDLY